MAGALGSRAGAAVTVGLVGTSVCTAAAVATIPMAMIALPVAIHPCMDLSPARIAAAPLVAAYRTTFGVKPDTNPLLITSNYRKYGFLGPKLFKRLDQLPKARFAAARRQMSTYAVAQRGEKYLYQVLQGNSFCLTPPHFIPRPQPTPVTIQPERPQLTDWPFPLPEQPRSNAIAPTISTAPVQPMPSRIEAAQVAQRGTIQRAPVRLPVAQRRQPETLDHSPLQASRSEPAMGTTTYPPPPASWQFPETEEFAEAFNRFQSRLAWTAEYRTPQTHTMMVARVDKLISAMRKSPTLRGLCFVIADNSLRHCGDRVALGLNEMELAHIDVQAASGKFTTEELFLLAEGFFKVHTLDKIALAKIGRLRNAGFEVDEVEIHLTYSQKLAGVLQLPGVTRNILFGSHHVTAEDLAEAEGLVRQGLDQSASVDFIAKWTPWQNAMERLHPEAYELVRQLQTVERDALSIKPFRTSEHEWMESFKTLEKREASLIHDVTTRLTRKFLEGRESNHH